jgi:CubicO group peptidase (beta-lactamase class C family)
MTRLRLLTLTVTLALATAAPSAQTVVCPFEDGPAVARLRTLVAAARARDLAALARTVTAAWSPASADADARVPAIIGLSRLSAQSQGLTEIRVCTPRPGLAVAGLQNTLTNAVDQIAVQVTGDDAATIQSVQTPIAIRSLRTGLVPAADADRAKELDDYVRRLAAHGAFSGVVAIAHQGATIYQQAFGEANRDTHANVADDTPFNVASLSKMMTAVAVLQLVERQLLSLDDAVASILPDASKDPGFGAVRVKHLLSHTSGLDQDPDHLAAVPGTTFIYSNLGFRLLGQVIAARTHMRFEDYLRLKVLAPAGMTNTGRFDMTEASPLLTFGYTLEPLEKNTGGTLTPVWKPNPYLHTISGGGMGGLYSTVPDLVKFATALTSGRLITADSLKLMKSPKPELGGPDGYGFGVMLYRASGVWGHGGDLPGADAALEFYNDGYVAVVLANMDNVTTPILQLTKLLFHSAPGQP